MACLLFVSGAVALVYEIVWQRQFALLFGSAAPATAAVLAGYFAGLGVGALVVGRFAARWSRPLRVYALLEICVGLGALLVTPLLSGFELAYPWLFEALSGHPASSTAVRTAVVFAVVLIPTFCMGGTLPLIGQWVDRGCQQLGITVGWFYLINTVGAGLGALAVPFVFLPQLGLAKTIWVCASANGLLSLAAWLLDRSCGSAARSLAVGSINGTQPSEKLVHRPQNKIRPKSVSDDGLAQPITLLAFISGFVTFALQVVWNRVFAQVHENSMYSFSVIVAVIIFALAIGAQLARFGLQRGIEPSRLLGGAWVIAGLALIGGPSLFLTLSNNLSYLPSSGGWTGYALRLVGLATGVLLIPMALLGVGLPAIMEQAGRAPGVGAGRVLGRLLAVNIAGSVVGALAAGFLFPQWLGMWSTLLGLATWVLIVGIWQWIRWSNAVRQRKFGFFFVLVWLMTLWPLGHLDLPRVQLATDQSERLVALTEGTYGITAVVERPGSRRLKLNNHYGLGGTASTGDERMQAHIPLLLHPAPRRVVFLGLGTGITAGGALFHPVEQVTVVELVPEVVAASREYFRKTNGGILDDKRTRVVADDARNFLRGSHEKFDVIVGDLVVPWRQGEGSLFTLEQFVAARESLAPGGLFCQWLPLFQLSEVEVNILTRTFLQAFPHAQVWRGDFSPTEPAIALIGSTGDLKFDAGQVRRRLAEMRGDPTNPQLQTPDGFWMSLVGGLEIANLPSDETRLNSEDRPWIELLGPMLHTGGSETSLFTGRRLQVWLDRVADRSQRSLALLPERESTAVKAGRVLAEMTLCISEDDRPGTMAAQKHLQQMLPAETFRELF
jgi:spermidine synthase